MLHLFFYLQIGTKPRYDALMNNPLVRDLLAFVVLYNFLIAVAVFALTGVAVLLATLF